MPSTQTLQCGELLLSHPSPLCHGESLPRESELDITICAGFR